MIRDGVIAQPGACRRARGDVIGRPCNCRGRRRPRAYQCHTCHGVPVDQLSGSGSELRTCKAKRGTVSLALVGGCDVQRLRVDRQMPNVIGDRVIAQSGAYRVTCRDVIRRSTDGRRRRRARAGQSHACHGIAHN